MKQMERRIFEIITRKAQLFVADRRSVSKTNGTFKNFQGQFPFQNGLIMNF